MSKKCEDEKKYNALFIKLLERNITSEMSEFMSEYINEKLILVSPENKEILGIAFYPNI